MQNQVTILSNYNTEHQMRKELRDIVVKAAEDLNSNKKLTHI